MSMETKWHTEDRLFSECTDSSNSKTKSQEMKNIDKNKNYNNYVNQHHFYKHQHLHTLL